ncbi:MAG: hypothetical protein ABID64_02365 [Nitrospirota bacterium]
MIKKIKRNKGTTLVEMAFYFMIVGVLLFVAMNFAIQTINVSTQSENFHELQANIDFMSQKIVSIVQTAESIDEVNSIFDNDEGKLSLNVSDPAASPTMFYMYGENIYMKEGSSAEVRINSESIKSTLLRFQKITFPKAPDQIMIDATFEPKNTDIINLEQTLSFHTSVSLRKYEN